MVKALKSRMSPPTPPSLLRTLIVDDEPVARRILREGIDEARRQGKAHAAGEMAELLMSLGDEP